MDSLRPLTSVADPAQAKLPDRGTTGFLQDDKPDRLAWCYRNLSSAWADNLRSRNTPAIVAKANDPIIYRTSGCVAELGFSGRAPARWPEGKATRTDFMVNVLSSDAAGLRQSGVYTGQTLEWLSQSEGRAEPTGEPIGLVARVRIAAMFSLTRCGDGQVQSRPVPVYRIPHGSMAYDGHKEIGSGRTHSSSATFRLGTLCQACASRGAVPPPYNGSIFTMDMPAGVMGLMRRKAAPPRPTAAIGGNLSFMWQNTRHPYWAMAARGDYDTLLPGMQFVRDGLDICRDRCRNIFHQTGRSSWRRAGGTTSACSTGNGVPAPALPLPGHDRDAGDHVRLL